MQGVGLLISGRRVPVPGVKVVTYLDDPKLALRVGRPDGNNDGRKRRGAVSKVILHTTKGIPGGKDRRPQDIRQGMGPDAKGDERVARFWSTDPTPSGAHLTVDHDGSVAQHADLAAVAAYHATAVNDVSIGIEVYQGAGAELYSGQLEVVRKVVDVITMEFGIQRQFHAPYRRRPLDRLDEANGDGPTCVGVFGHRDQTDRRGAGDPGDAIFDVLALAGYEAFDFDRNSDRETWNTRQREINARLAVGQRIAVDGIPGPATVAALRALGYAGGLWALPPAKPSGAIEAQLDAFLGVWSIIAGSEADALDTIETWLQSRALRR